METNVKNEGEYLQVCNDLKKQYDEIRNEYEEKLRKKDDKIQFLRDKYDKDIIIKNLSSFKDDEFNVLFHAGTKLKGKDIYSAGGRVLNFVNISNSFFDSRNNIIKQIKKLNWKEGFFRKDIGHRVIKN